MKITDRKLAKLQEGGEIPAGAPAPEAAPAPEQAPEQGGDPMAQLVAAFQQGLETQDCQLLAQAAQAFLELVGGGQPSPEQQAPGQPVYRRGGRLIRFEKRS